jgi:hypothetical protein
MPYAKTHTFPQTGPLRFELRELIGHPFYYWPKTLLTYQVDFSLAKVSADQLSLINLQTGQPEPFQLSKVRTEQGRLRSALVHFFSDLPSEAIRRFELRAVGGTLERRKMEAKHENDSLVLDTGVTRIRIPASREVWGEAPGPVMQMGYGAYWFGRSRVVSPNRRLKRIIATPGESGPLFLDYSLTYEFERGGTYRANFRVIKGYEFILYREEMTGFGRDNQTWFETSWTDFHPTHRQAPNYPSTRAKKFTPPGFDPKMGCYRYAHKR